MCSASRRSISSPLMPRSDEIRRTIAVDIGLALPELVISRTQVNDLPELRQRPEFGMPNNGNKTRISHSSIIHYGPAIVADSGRSTGRREGGKYFRTGLRGSCRAIGSARRQDPVATKWKLPQRPI